MKKYLYYTLCAFFLFLTSCTKEETQVAEVESATEEKVPIILSFRQPVTLTAETKATPGMEMGVNPAIKNIHVAVFGSSGYLQEYVSAAPCDASGNAVSGFTTANATTAYFLVRLSVRTKLSRVHIIANGPPTLSYNAYENTLMQGLRTTDGNGAYWTRLELPTGIRAKMVTNDNGEEVYLEDANGELIATDETKEAFTGLVLIRNFAGITVRERVDVEGGVPNFDLVGFTVCNMPKEGAVAMYSATHDCWVDGYEAKCIMTDDPSADGFYRGSGLIRWDGLVYPGFPTNPMINSDDTPGTVEEFNAGGVAVGPGETKFIYERAVTSSSAPFVLLAGRYVQTGTPTSETPIQYYRLDITKNDRYVPFYRNINYYITLTGVSVAGYDTPAEAARHNSGDNFSISLDTSTLPDVSNGTVRMYVETTALDLLYTPDSKSVWFQFATIEETPQYLNSDVTVSELEGGEAINLGTTTYSGNKGYVNFTLNEPSGQEVLTSVVKLVGEYEDNGSTSKLSREVTIRTFNKQNMTLTLSPDTVAPLAGEETTLTVEIPKTLTWSMFPLEFSIEDSAKSLNPSTDGIPVRTDVNSIVTGHTTEPSYQFIYTLNWSDYLELLEIAERAGDTGSTVPFDVVMKTIKATNATTVYVANEYFTTANVELLNDATNMITPSTQTISGNTATIEVTTSDAWALSVARSNGAAAAGVTMSEYSGSTAVTGRSITVTLPDNNGGNAISYTVTLTNTVTGVMRKAIIVQQGKTVEMDYYNTSRSIAASGGTFPVNVLSEVDYTISVLDPNGNTIGTPVSGNANSSTTRVNVPVAENDTVESRRLTIHLSNATGSITRDLVITQEASTANLYIVDTGVYSRDISATVEVTSSIATVVNVYDSSYNLVSTDNVSASPSGTSVEVDLTVNPTSADRTFNIELCNASGAVLRSGTITQYGPSVGLRTDDSSVAYNATSATISVYADMDWSLSVSGGSGTASLSTDSGNATDWTNVTLTMPANSNSEEKAVYTVTIQNSDGSIVRTVTVTQGYAPVVLTIDASEGSVSSSTYSYTDNIATLSMSSASYSSYNGYVELSNGSNINVRVTDGYLITSVVVNRYAYRRVASCSTSGGDFDAGNTSSSTADNDTWTATGSGVDSVEFSISNSGNGRTKYYRVNYVTITYIKE